MIEKALLEKKIFERFYVQGIFDVKSHQNSDGSTLNLRTAFVRDETGQCETLEKNVHYVMNHVYLVKYKYSRILKTIYVSTVK